MISKIADLMVDEISSLNFVERIGGVVKPITEQIKDGEDMVDKIFPGVYREDTTCDQRRYQAMTPDTTVKSVIYFEGGEADVLDESRRYIDFAARLQLVCWCNLPKINQAYTDASLIMANIMKNMPKTLANTDYLTKMRIFYDGYEKDEGIFDPYTYNEEEFQYLIFPFDWFVLNYNVFFSVAKDCPDDVVLDPSTC